MSDNHDVPMLVTGGAGFIGSNFIRYWLDGHPNDSIVNLDLLTYAGDRHNLEDLETEKADRYKFVHGNIADADLLDGLFKTHRLEVVVNFAAESHNSRAVLDPGAFVRTNVSGTQVLLEAARRSGVRRFHQISTCEVYGDLPLDSDAAFTESSPYRPRTPYSASKAAADLLVRAYHETFGLPVTITNSANTFGPWQHPEKLIPLFITNAIEDVPLPLYRHSENRREWIHVTDHCRAVEAVLEGGRPGETYHLGTGVEKSVEQIADALLALLGRPSTLKTYVEDRPGHDRRYLLDHSKISQELGWAPSVPFAEGLKETVEWYERQRDWWQPKRDRHRTEVNETAWSSAGTAPRRAS